MFDFGDRARSRLDILEVRLRTMEDVLSKMSTGTKKYKQQEEDVRVLKDYCQRLRSDLYA